MLSRARFHYGQANIRNEMRKKRTRSIWHAPCTNIRLRHVVGLFYHIKMILSFLELCLSAVGVTSPVFLSVRAAQLKTSA